MQDNHNGGGWDAFDWNTWGEAAPDDRAGDESANGERTRTPAGGEQPEAAGERGRWVSEGGVMRWERPGELDEEEPSDAASEANSPWATDAVELPPGAPEGMRVRAARAWMLRQRALESEAVGYLLLERRKLQETRAGEGGGPPEREAEPPSDDDPMSLALAEHQAAIEEYERLLGELDEIAAHSGPARVLVEFYLRLTERLAELAGAPEAPAEFADALLLAQVEDEEAAESGRPAPTPRSHAEWQGRAEAVTQTRRRVERVTAPEPED
ncbi:MAG TPA: hypothetical protein VFU88_01655 [Ktedonobacterales bacterium]|nr:hypothetical protein [Ktedonobacterales bacterium]